MKATLALVCSLFVAAFAFAASSTVPEISHAELKAAIASQSAVILDVNGTDSFKAGHIPGAADFIANKGHLTEILPIDKSALVIAYCGNEQCSAYADAAAAATTLGYTNVKHYAPGIDGWKKAGEPVEKGK
jgi:rhodanese-related sulfurtransferase